LAAARSNVTPPMSISSIASASVTSGRLTVATKG